MTVTVSDGSLTDSETFTITCNEVNNAPVLNGIGNQSVDEGSTLTFTASATDPDIPADTLTFSLDSASLALGMTIDPNTGLFSWTPTEAQGGSDYSVTVTVSDGSLTDSETFTITCNEVTVNQPPTIVLTNVITGLAENADTSSAVRIADIEINDDALGSNLLTLAGPDAESFEIVGSQIFLRAGTPLPWGMPSIPLTDFISPLQSTMPPFPARRTMRILLHWTLPILTRRPHR